MQTRTDTHGKKGQTRARYHFDSLGELGEYINGTPRTWSCNSSVSNPPEHSWDLNATYDNAVEMARFGWIEGAQKAQAALKAFRPATPQPDTKVDFYGHRPHVPRFCAGASDSMIRHTPRADMGCGAVLTLIVPVNALAHVPAQNMAHFGTAVAQYVNQLETNGTRVELIGAFVSNVSGWRVAHTWTLKHADQPLDLAVVAFSIGHPAMFRRLGLALRERCAAPMDWGYGQTQAAEVDDLINAPAGAVVLNGMREADRHAPTAEAGLAYVSRMIEKALEAQRGEGA